MPAAAADFETMFRHCAAITSRIELDEVIRTTIESLRELLPSARSMVTTDESEMQEVLATDPSDASTYAIALVIGGDTIGALRVVAENGHLTERDRTRLITLTPAIASAVRNALFLAHQRESLDRQRKLDTNKSSFIWMTAAGLDAPLDEVTKLVTVMREGSGESLRETAARVLSETQKLADLVEEILKLSLTESSQIVLPNA